jgi:hypothetical protein
VDEEGVRVCHGDVLELGCVVGKEAVLDRLTFRIKKAKLPAAVVISPSVSFLIRVPFGIPSQHES